MIVQAAIFVPQTKLILTLPRPARHADIKYAALNTGLSDAWLSKATDGFLIENGRFLNRQDAAKHAFDCKQIKDQIFELYTNHLW